jgi:hypothetical protein
MITKNEIIYDLTKNILSDCKENHIDIRLFGSVALLFLDRSKIEFFNEYNRVIADIDIIVRPNHIAKLENYFKSRGYATNRQIKMLYGNQRRGFYLENNISIDVFIGNITLCQDIFILDRFNLSYPTITPSDLFLTKIQKKKLSEKDVFDINFILGYDIDFPYIIELSSKNWNWWKTLTINIPFLMKNKISENNKTLLTNLLFQIDSSNKTINWKLRSIIRERVQWYNDVE